VAAAVACGALLHGGERWPLVRVASAACALALVVTVGFSTWRVAPHPLAYVNEAFGGPERAWRLVADSNLDWGQDLARAAPSTRVVPAAGQSWRPVWLLYFGTADPAAYGVDAVVLTPSTRTVRPERVRGRVLVSASVLALYDTPIVQRLRSEGELIGQVGHSILVYELP
jgi:hypothetical protein